MLARQALTLPVATLAIMLASASVGHAGWHNGTSLQGWTFNGTTLNGGGFSNGPGLQGPGGNGTKASGARHRIDGSAVFNFNHVTVRSIKLKPKAKTAAPKA